MTDFCLEKYGKIEIIEMPDVCFIDFEKNKSFRIIVHCFTHVEFEEFEELAEFVCFCLCSALYNENENELVLQMFSTR